MDPIPKKQIREKLRDRDTALGYAESTHRVRGLRLKPLIKYMDLHSIEFYTPEIGQSFLIEYNQTKPSSESMRTEVHLIVTLLNEIYGDIPPRKQKESKLNPLYGDMAHAAEEFLLYQKDVKRLREASISNHRRILSRFTQKMDLLGVKWESLQYNDLIEFLSSRSNSKVDIFSTVKGFMSFAYKRGITRRDLSLEIKSFSPPRKEKIPSFYTPEEVLKVENTVDRRTSTGKRDYAMMLLASRLGLRASDICRLEFRNIDWDKNQISLIQYKTNRTVTLPLLPEVGEAIVEYVKYARPQSAFKKIFLNMVHPHYPCKRETITDVVHSYFIKSGVECKGKRKGPHTLRHSLATAMLNEGAVLPVISECLGHSSTQSTMHYLNVAIGSLLQCSHDVPLVSESFYTQKGGILYE